VKFLLAYGGGFFIQPSIRKLLFPALFPWIGLTATSVTALVLSWSPGWVAAGLLDEQLERLTGYLGELMTRGANLLSPSPEQDLEAGTVMTDDDETVDAKVDALSPSGSTLATVALVKSASQSSSSSSSPLSDADQRALGKFQITQDRKCICESLCTGEGDEARCEVTGIDPPYHSTVLEGAPRPSPPLCTVPKRTRHPCHKDWRTLEEFEKVTAFQEYLAQERLERVSQGGGVPGEDPFSGIPIELRDPEPPSEYTRTLAFALAMLVYGVGVCTIMAIIPASIMLQSFLVIISALYALTATARVAREMLDTITNLLLNAGLGEEFFDVRDDSLGAFLQRLETAVVPSQIVPILFSHVLDPLRDAFQSVVWEGKYGLYALYDRIVHMLHAGRLSDEIVSHMVNAANQERGEWIVRGGQTQLTKDGTCPCYNE